MAHPLATGRGHDWEGSSPVPQADDGGYGKSGIIAVGVAVGMLWWLLLGGLLRWLLL